jgi:hypothetical protein
MAKPNGFAIPIGIERSSASRNQTGASRAVRSLAHDLFRKSVSTFRDHALSAG